MERMRTRLLIVMLLAGVLCSPRVAVAKSNLLGPLYKRVVADIAAKKPIVVTVHVALCDNSIINCGSKTMGNGDDPKRNLYWGGAAGFRAYFRIARGFRRIHLDKGDGKVVLERAVYRLRVKRPSWFWRSRGVKGGFEVLVVGLAYRGAKIARAMDAFIKDVSDDKHGGTLKLSDGRTIAIGGRGHLVGYAGHNHLMDVPFYRFPKQTRRSPVGYFGLACMTAQYLASKLRGPAFPLLLTRILMYPGAFTIGGLVRGFAKGGSARAVFRAGADSYARDQKRKKQKVRIWFTYCGKRSFLRRYR
jgi:hypothetical protein